MVAAKTEAGKVEKAVVADANVVGSDVKAGWHKVVGWVGAGFGVAAAGAGVLVHFVS